MATVQRIQCQQILHLRALKKLFGKYQTVCAGSCMTSQKQGLSRCPNEVLRVLSTAIVVSLFPKLLLKKTHRNMVWSLWRWCDPRAHLAGGVSVKDKWYWFWRSVVHGGATCLVREFTAIERMVLIDRAEDRDDNWVFRGMVTNKTVTTSGTCIKRQEVQRVCRDGSKAMSTTSDEAINLAPRGVEENAKLQICPRGRWTCKPILCRFVLQEVQNAASLKLQSVRKNLQYGSWSRPTWRTRSGRAKRLRRRPFFNLGWPL